MINLKKLLKKFLLYLRTNLFFLLNKNNNFILQVRVTDAIKYLEENRRINSIFFWTTHKCASTFVSKFLLKIANESNLKYFDYAGHVWDLGDKIKLDNPYKVTTDCDFLYRTYNEIYGPIRTPFEFDNMYKFNNIFF
jgi:hypothetical protein